MTNRSLSIAVASLISVACGDAAGPAAGGGSGGAGGDLVAGAAAGGQGMGGGATGGEAMGGEAMGGEAMGGEAMGGAGGGSSVDPSAGCGEVSPYASGASTEDELLHDELTRTFRVHLPPSYDADAPLPLVLMLHGGGGSGLQLEEDSSGMSTIADREGFIAVYPDGTGFFKTWNAGGCCGSAVSNTVDDVGFLQALLDQLEGTLCVDRRRVFAAGMSNGGMMTHRLACELPERFAAFAPVAGVEMAPSCTPSEPRPLMHIHGSADGHVPVAGGLGCGPANVAFPALSETMETRRLLNGCEPTTSVLFSAGDGTCSGYQGCEADVVLCSIEGGGHSWPGGEPAADLVDCPADGPQSTTFFASEEAWRFFEEHPTL